jgi:hypothetical protein
LLFFSKRRSFREVACLEKTEKFAPSGLRVTPGGMGCPGFVFHIFKSSR